MQGVYSSVNGESDSFHFALPEQHTCGAMTWCPMERSRCQHNAQDACVPCRAAYDADSHAVVSRQTLEMLCLTWNVNEQRPDPSSSLFQWVADLSAKSSVVVVALQEIEMGGGSVAIAAAKDVLKKSAQVCIHKP